MRALVPWKRRSDGRLVIRGSRLTQTVPTAVPATEGVEDGWTYSFVDLGCVI